MSSEIICPPACRAVVIFRNERLLLTMFTPDLLPLTYSLVHSSTKGTLHYLLFHISYFAVLSMKATHILSRASNSARSSPRCLRLAQPTPNSPVRPSTLSPFCPQKRTLATTHSASTHPALVISSLQRRHPQTRPISTTQRSLKGLQPDSDDPAPPNTEPSTSSTAGPTAASISDAEYHEIADQYLDTLVYAAEELSESSENGIDVEYSVKDHESLSI